ncbi:MAG: HAD family hydrolase [Filimonas sp.]|nr:HAD family hydrolase [Filimonas sp.]
MKTKSDKLLILDLDETLIHATQTELAIASDFRFDNYFVYKRPGLQKFLHDVSLHFTIAIWSSAGDDYVKAIVQQFKTEEISFSFVWGRSKCSLKRNPVYDTYSFEKRLDKLKKNGFRLEQILIVDDSPAKSRTNYGNAIYIKEFTGDSEDRELSFLYDYLLTLKNVENVRTIEKRRWRQ